MKATLAAAIGTAALAGLLFGFDTAVIAGVTGELTRVFALDAGTLGVTVSAALWGTLVGALAAGKPGDAFGSRRVLGALGLFYLLAGIGCAMAPGWWSFLAFRFMCGLAIGGSSVLAPVYIAEIAPPARRGLLVGLFQFAIVSGILVAYLSNWIVGLLAPPTEAWRWKLAVSAAPALVFLLLLARIPDSPRWLLIRGRAADARQPGPHRPCPGRSGAGGGRDGGGAGGRSGRRAAVVAASPQAHPARGPARRVQPARGHQRRPLLSERHLRAGGLRLARPAGGGDRGRQPPVHGPWHGADRPGRATHPARGGRGGNDGVPAGRGRRARPGAADGRAAARADRVHRLFRAEPGRGDLGLPVRDLPFARPRARIGGWAPVPTG